MRAAQYLALGRLCQEADQRQEHDDAANATINRELAALRRMFRLGERSNKVAQRPFIDLLRGANTGKMVVRLG